LLHVEALSCFKSRTPVLAISGWVFRKRPIFVGFKAKMAILKGLPYEMSKLAVFTKIDHKMVISWFLAKFRPFGHNLGKV